MIHVFHHNDQDGLGSAALVRRAFPKQAMRFICCCYDVPLDSHLDSIDSNDQVYIVDYSFKESTVKELLGIIEKVGVDHVVWLDHHKSSAELVKKHPDLLKLGGTVDLRFSGMALTWMFLQGLPYSEESFQKCPFCVRLVSDYDIWTKVYPECDPFKMGMDTHDLSVESEIWDKVLSDESCLLEVVNQGRTVKNFLKHYYAHKMQRYGFVTRFAGYDCLAINIKDDKNLDYYFDEELLEKQFVYYKSLFNIGDSSIFELRYNGFSYKEISRLLDIPITTVDGRLYKIRKVLHERFKNVY